MADIKVTLTIGDYARLMPLITGAVKPEGIALRIVTSDAGSWPSRAEMLRRAQHDPDAQGGDFLHWAVADIPASVSGVARGAKFPPASRELKNDFDASGYGGPCPPAGTHHYVFSLYAVGAAKFSGTPAQLENFLKAHTLATAVLTGRYKRK